MYLTAAALDDTTAAPFGQFPEGSPEPPDDAWAVCGFIATTRRFSLDRRRLRTLAADYDLGWADAPHRGSTLTRRRYRFLAYGRWVNVKTFSLVIQQITKEH